jgi:hypothetical protein
VSTNRLVSTASSRLAATGAASLVVLSLAAVHASAAPTPSPAATTPTPGSPLAGRTCTPERLDAVQARVHAAVTKRLAAIDRLQSRLADRQHVTDAHRSTLKSLYANDSSGLQAVDAKVQADTTCAAAVTDGRTVVTSYRVFLLLVPQTHLVAAADTGTYAAGRLEAAEPKAQAAIDALTDPTKKAAAQARLDDLTSQVNAAQADLSGVADGALALVPADIPAQLPTLDGYRAKVRDAASALRTAMADAQALRTLLHP